MEEDDSSNENVLMGTHVPAPWRMRIGVKTLVVGALLLTAVAGAGYSIHQLNSKEVSTSVTNLDKSLAGLHETHDPPMLPLDKDELGEELERDEYNRRRRYRRRRHYGA